MTWIIAIAIAVVVVPMLVFIAGVCVVNTNCRRSNIASRAELKDSARRAENKEGN